MSDRMDRVGHAALEPLEGRVLFSASSVLEGLSVTPAAGPEISAIRSGEIILDGQSDTLSFVAELEGTTPRNADIVITNDGTSTLEIGKITIPSGYVMVRRPAAQLAPGESGVLRLRLNTAMVGHHTGQVTIVTNDADENPFNFPVSGRVVAEGTPPDIDVFPNNKGPELAPNGTVNVGNVAVGGTLNYLFRVRNDGGAPLTISDIQLPAGFTISNPLNMTTFNTGDSDFFTISVNTTQQRVLSGQAVITTNDPDAGEKTLRFTLTATVGNPSVGPDTFESDNTAATSRFTHNNTGFRPHTIHSANDTDWIRFYVPSRSYVAVRAIHGVPSQVNNGFDPAGDIRLRIYGPLGRPNNPTGLTPTAPNWNASAVPTVDPQMTTLVRSGPRALEQGWYWVQIDGMGSIIDNYGIRVQVRALTPPAAPAAAQTANTAVFAAVQRAESQNGDDTESESSDPLLEVEPILSFLA